METLEILRDPSLRGLYAHALLAGLAVVLMCGVLSVLVVVKRLGFVGQGVSHSAFGGIGVAAVLASLGWLGAGESRELWEFGVVVAFCLAAALGIAAISNRRDLPEDTAIGLFLVGSMALGAVLVEVARRGGGGPSWESILFGSILFSTPTDVAVAWNVAGAVLAGAWLARRPLLFWAFEEESARAFGVSERAMKAVLMVLLALAVVVAMRLVGVVLATALLVLPGATALRLSDRLWGATGVLSVSVLVGVVGLVVGLVASVELNWQTGPTIVLTLTAMFAGAAAVKWARGRGRAA